MNIRSIVDRYSLSAVAYTLVAALSALTEWFTFFILQRRIDAFIATIIAFFVATFANYIMSREFAFNSKRSSRDEIILLFVFSGIAFVVNLAVFSFFYLLTTIGPMTAKIIGTCSAFAINYGFRQFVIFSSVSKFPTVSELHSRFGNSMSPGGPRVPVDDPVGTSEASNYPGHRILEAMRSAPRYADTIYALARSVCHDLDRPLLDFGAGDGVFVDKFLQDGFIVDCVEPDIDNQHRLRVRGIAAYADVRTLANERYAFAYSINVLEHLRELDYYLGELYRVLRPGGTLFIFVPAFNVLWTSLDTEVHHIQRFTQRTLTATLVSAGFEIQSLRYFDSVGFLAALTVRLLEKLNVFRYSPKSVGFYDRVILPFSLFGDYFLSHIAGKNLVAVVKRPTHQ